MCSQTTTVNDTTAPVIAALPGPSTIECPASPAFTQATATDTCGSSFTLSSNDVVSAGCGASRTGTRLYTTPTSSSNTILAFQTINVKDTPAPSIPSLPPPNPIQSPTPPAS